MSETNINNSEDLLQRINAKKVEMKILERLLSEKVTVFVSQEDGKNYELNLKRRDIIDILKKEIRELAKEITVLMKIYNKTASDEY